MIAVGEDITFGGWLKQRRNELGVSQEELATRLGLSPIMLRKLEAGHRRPSGQIAHLLAEQFHIPADEREAFVTFARTGRAGRGAAGSLVHAPPRAPWRAAHLRHTNLPTALSPLLGREADAATLLDLLRSPHAKVRLLTLTGPPGIGKTRLALHVAAQLREQFDDGVFLIELAPITHPDRVLPTVAQTLGVREVGGQSIGELLLQHIRAKRLLLVLDNFEQVLDAAPAVTALLEASPWLKVLTTSREALHVRGERRFEVPPLTLPDLTRTGELPVLGANPAVALFVAGAQAGQPGFALTPENALAVASICARLEGLPLAIELAAARAWLLAPAAMLAQLEHRLPVLIGGARDLPERQRTLRGTLAWSYDLLNDGEQQLFRRLAVFAGGRTVDAVAAVCNAAADFPIDILAGLESLLDKSLLRREEGAAGEPRFGMLELIREYAFERLEASAEPQVIQQRHAGFFLRLVEQAARELRGPQQLAWLHRLEREHDNIRAALRWALDSNAPEMGLRLVGALRWFWTLHSHLHESLQWAGAVLAMPSAQGRSPARAKALWSAGVLAWLQGDPTAQPLLEESVAIWREVDDTRGLGSALHPLGMVALMNDQPERARTLEMESVALLRAAGDRLDLILALISLSTITVAVADKAAHSDYGAYQGARALLGEAIQLAREAGDQWGLALGLRSLGHLAMRQGDYGAARPFFQESMALQWEIGSPHEAASSLGALAQLAQLEGDWAAAAELYDRSLHEYINCSDRYGIVSSMASIGGVALEMGHIRRAAEVLTEALRLVRELGSARHAIGVVEVLGGLMVAEDQPARAGVLLAAAQALSSAYSLARPAVTQREYTRYVERAQAGVDEATWQQAWARGAALSLEEALDGAAEGLAVSKGYAPGR